MMVKTPKIPFPEFDISGFRERQNAAVEQLFGAPMPKLSALSVSMPVSFPFDTKWTPDVHDRIWPDMWCPGVNHHSPQAIDCQFCLPTWERSGAVLYDIINGYIGQTYKGTYLDSDSHTLEELIWAWDNRNSLSGPMVQGIGPVVFPEMSFDLTEGCTVCFWAQSPVIFGDTNEKFVFNCDNFKVWFSVDDGSFYSYLNFQCDADSGTIHAVWDLGLADVLWMNQESKHWAIVMTPYAVPALTGSIVGTGEYGPESSFTNNYDIATHATPVYSHGFVSFTLNAEQNQILGTTTLTLTGAGVGAEYPTSVRLRAVEDGNSHLPVNIGEAVSQFANLTSESVTFTPTGNTYVATLDVTAMCQVVVNQYNWTPGNQIVFYLDTPTSSSGGHYMFGKGGMSQPTLEVAAISGGVKVELWEDSKHIDGDLVVLDKSPASHSGQMIFASDSEDRSTGQNFSGLLKDFRIYDKPLTAGDILDIYRVPEELYSQPSPVLHPLSLDAIVEGSADGVVCDGSANVSITTAISGGAVVGGTALITDGGNGGLVVDGTATPTGGVTVTTSGGVIAGGTCLVSTDYAVTPTGGLVLSEYPFAYRRTITVPAGKVTEDVDNFYLGISVVLDPAKVGDAVFNITTTGMKNVPFELREYDAETGRLTMYIRTSLKSGSDNILYLFYGVS